jgi:hypothetical protein
VAKDGSEIAKSIFSGQTADLPPKMKAELLKAAKAAPADDIPVESPMPDIHNLKTAKDCDTLYRWLVLEGVSACSGGSQNGVRKAEGYMKIAREVMSLRESDYRDLEAQLAKLETHIQQLEDAVRQASITAENNTQELKKRDTEINMLRSKLGG